MGKNLKGKRKPTRDPALDIPVVVQDVNSTTEIARHIRKAFIGYGVMSCFGNNDCGRGPQFQSAVINTRVPSKKRMEELIVLCGGNPHDRSQPLTHLARFLPEHAITVGIQRHALKADTLFKNSATIPRPDRIPHVQWNAPDDVAAYVINGAGRMFMAQNFLVSELESRSYRQALENSRASPDDVVAKNALRDIRERISKQTSWLFAFYDHDLIEQSPYKAELQLTLASNSAKYQVYDTSDEALVVVLNSLASLPPETLGDKLAKDLHQQLSRAPRRLSSTLKNGEFLSQLVRLNVYSRHWTRIGLCANTLHAIRPAPILILSALIDVGVTVLDFLVRDVSKMANGKWDLSHLPDPQPDLLDPEFFHIAGTVYMNTLHPVMTGFGVPGGRQEGPEKDFNAAFARYISAIMKDVDRWTDRRILHITKEEPALAPYTHILETLPERLHAVLADEIFMQGDLTLNLPTNTPLLSNYFLTDVTGFLSRHTTAMTEVLVMLEPFYHDSITARFGQDAYTLLANWVLHHNPDVDVKKVIYRILSVLLQHRTYGISRLTAQRRMKIPSAKALTEEPDMGRVLAPNSQDTVSSPPAFPKLYARGSEVMKEWFRNAGDDSRFSATQPLSEKQRADFAKLYRVPYGREFARALESTAVVWHNRNVQRPGQTIQTHARQLVSTIWTHVENIEPCLFDDVIWSMRTDLTAALDAELSVAGHSFAGLWDGITHPPQPAADVPPEPSQRAESDFSAPLRFALDAHAIQVMENASATAAVICRLITHTALGAVDTDQGLALVPSVHHKASALFAELAAQAARISDIYRRPGIADPPIGPCTDAELRQQLGRLSLPDTFRVAGLDDVRAYRQSLTKDKLAQDVRGPNAFSQYVKDLQNPALLLELATAVPIVAAGPNNRLARREDSVPLADDNGEPRGADKDGGHDRVSGDADDQEGGADQSAQEDDDEDGDEQEPPAGPYTQFAAASSEEDDSEEGDAEESDEDPMSRQRIHFSALLDAAKDSSDEEEDEDEDEEEEDEEEEEEEEDEDEQDEEEDDEEEEEAMECNADKERKADSDIMHEGREDHGAQLLADGDGLMELSYPDDDEVIHGTRLQTDSGFSPDPPVLASKRGTDESDESISRKRVKRGREKGQPTKLFDRVFEPVLTPPLTLKDSSSDDIASNDDTLVVTPVTADISPLHVPGAPRISRIGTFSDPKTPPSTFPTKSAKNIGKTPPATFHAMNKKLIGDP